MKKILKIFFIISIFFINFWISSANECKIENDTWESLKNYIKNTEKILNNISAQINWWNSALNNYSLKVLNDIFNYDNLTNKQIFASFHRKAQEVPKEIERDYKKLEELDKKLYQIINKIWENNISSKKANNICSWITNCGFTNNDSLWDITRNIAQNQEKVKSIYLKVIAWEKDFRDDICENWILKVQWCIFLVEKNFIENLKENYLPENSLICSEKNGFFKEIKEKSNNIFQNNKSAKDWIQKWKEAWAMVNGINPLPKEQKEKIERELLKKELNRQWVSWEQQQNILNSLDKYNNDWWFKNNNFFTNSFESTKKKFQNEFQRIKQEVSADFLENYAKKSKENLPVNTLTKVQWNSTKIKLVEERIREIYNANNTYFSNSEVAWLNVNSRLIKIHTELSNSINTLKETCKIAVKVCNEQDSWSWKCWDCNW